MTKEQKIVPAKVDALELAKQLGNASQACNMMGDSRDGVYRFKELMTKAANSHCRILAARTRPEGHSTAMNGISTIKKSIIGLKGHAPLSGHFPMATGRIDNLPRIHQFPCGPEMMQATENTKA